MKNKNYKMYVWENVLEDYTSGLVCIFARTLEEAFELLYKKDPVAWSQLMGVWDRFSWVSEEIKSLGIKYPNEDLTVLQKRYLKSKKIEIFGGYIKPKIVQKSEAFLVHGGA